MVEVEVVYQSVCKQVATCGEFSSTGELSVSLEEMSASIQKASNIAVEIAGEGSGAVYGTKVHSLFKQIINEMRNEGFDVSSEVSYLNGKVVPYGTKGSVRADVVIGNVERPTAIYDLKTGGAKLTKRQMEKYKKNLPESVKDNIFEVKPDVSK